MWILIFLVGCAWFDLKTKTLPVWFLTTASVLLGLFRIWNWRNDTLLWLGGAGIGILFFLISKCTKEAIGYGDSWIICFLGVYLGLWELLWLLGIAFTLSAMASVLFLMFHNYSGKCSIPFVPFLAISYVGVLYL